MARGLAQVPNSWWENFGSALKDSTGNLLSGSIGDVAGAVNAPLAFIEGAGGNDYLRGLSERGDLADAENRAAAASQGGLGGYAYDASRLAMGLAPGYGVAKPLQLARRAQVAAKTAQAARVARAAAKAAAKAPASAAAAAQTPAAAAAAEAATWLSKQSPTVQKYFKMARWAVPTAAVGAAGALAAGTVAGQRAGAGGLPTGQLGAMTPAQIDAQQKIRAQLAGRNAQGLPAGLQDESNRDQSSNPNAPQGLGQDPNQALQFLMDMYRQASAPKGQNLGWGYSGNGRPLTAAQYRMMNEGPNAGPQNANYRGDRQRLIDEDNPFSPGRMAALQGIAQIGASYPGQSLQRQNTQLMNNAGQQAALITTLKGGIAQERQNAGLRSRASVISAGLNARAKSPEGLSASDVETALADLYRGGAQ